MVKFLQRALATRGVAFAGGRSGGNNVGKFLHFFKYKQWKLQAKSAKKGRWTEWTGDSGGNENLWLCVLVKVSKETPKLYSHRQRANDDCSIDSNTPTADGRLAADDGEWWKGTASSGEKAVDWECRLQRPLVQEGLQLYTTQTLAKTSNVKRKILWCNEV